MSRTVVARSPRSANIVAASSRSSSRRLGAALCPSRQRINQALARSWRPRSADLLYRPGQSGARASDSGSSTPVGAPPRQVELVPGVVVGAVASRTPALRLGQTLPAPARCPRTADSRYVGVELARLLIAVDVAVGDQPLRVERGQPQQAPRAPAHQRPPARQPPPAAHPDTRQRRSGRTPRPATARW